MPKGATRTRDHSMSLRIVRDNSMNARRQQSRAKQSQDRAGNNVPEKNPRAALIPRRRNSAEQPIPLVQANRRRTENAQQRKQAHRNISRVDDGMPTARFNWKKTRADVDAASGCKPPRGTNSASYFNPFGRSEPSRGAFRGAAHPLGKKQPPFASPNANALCVRTVIIASGL